MKYLMPLFLIVVILFTSKSSYSSERISEIQPTFICESGVTSLEECQQNFSSEEINFLLSAPTITNGFNALLRCESFDYQPELCDIGETITQARIVQKHSKSTCNSNWNKYGSAILVSNGCRATFLVTSSSNKRVYTQSCSSNNYQYAECPINNAQTVWLYRKDSKSSCQYGVSWGYDDQNVWVNNGCRARFDYIQ